MKLERKDWLIIIGFYLMTLSTFIVGEFEISRKNYFFIVFFNGFLPIYITHSTSLGLRFANLKFSILWILLIALNGILFNKIVPIWTAMTCSFFFYIFLRELFKRITKENPIPLYIGPGTSLKYNKIEKRMENKIDGLFSFISFMGGILLSVLIFVWTK